MDNPSDVQDEVSKVLDSLLVSSEELAQNVGVAYGTLYAWSVGRRNPSPENAQCLAEVAARRGRELSKRANQLLQVLETSGE